MILRSVIFLCSIVTLSSCADLQINGLRSGNQEIYNAGDEIILKCRLENGNRIQPLDWKKDYKAVENEGVISRTDFDYTLTIADASNSHTGNYSCTVWNEFNQEVSTWIYIFVADLDNIFVNDRRVVVDSVSFTQLSYVRCLVTHPDTEVRLFKGSEELKHRTYDPMRGMAIPAYSWFTKQGLELVTCKGTRDGRKGELQIQVLARDDVTDIHQPTITPVDDDSRFPYVGSTLRLKCVEEYDSNVPLDQPPCVWEYPPSTKPRISEALGNPPNARTKVFLLTLRDVGPNDNGLYICKCAPDEEYMKQAVHNIQEIGDNQHQVRFKDIDQHDLDMQLQHGEMIKMSVTYYVYPAQTSYRMVWSYVDMDGKLQARDPNITTSATVHNHGGPRNAPMQRVSAKNVQLTEKYAHNYYLEIANAQVTNSGNYTLLVHAGPIVKNLTFFVTVNSPGELKLISNATRLRYSQLGSEQSIVLHALGLPRPKVHWSVNECNSFKPGSICRHRVHRSLDGQGEEQFVADTTFGTRYELRIPAVERSGRYTFLLLDDPAQKAHVAIIATEIPSAELGLSIHASAARVYTGQSVVVTCEAQRYDYADEVKWTLPRGLEGSEYTSVDITGVHTTVYNLTIKAAGLNDAGTFTCRAWNDYLGSLQSRSLTLGVLNPVKPALAGGIRPQQTLTVPYSNQIAITCNVTGEPTPQITWYKGTKLFAPGLGHQVSPDKQVIAINRAVPEDTGSYRCEAVNSAGRVERTVDLEVDGGPKGMSTKNKVIMISVVSVAVSIAIILLIFMFVIKRNERKRCHQLEQLYRQLMASANAEAPVAKINPELPINEQMENLPYDIRYEIPKEKINFCYQIGQGQFGRVIEANYYVDNGPPEGLRVAVKVPRDGMSVDHQRALLSELKMMIYIGHHPNILGLLGAITKSMVKGELSVVFELCKLGSLRDHLCRNRMHFFSEIADIRPEAAEYAPIQQQGGDTGYLMPNRLGADKSSWKYKAEIDPQWLNDLQTRRLKNQSLISTGNLISFGYQTAAGMVYLAQRNLIHRDLAARNLLLNEHGVVKISDFGLARHDRTYRIRKADTPLPVKWMALESIVYREFTTMTDVWSLGVVLWEVFSLGELPYPGIEADRAFLDRLRNGYRMDPPPEAPPTVADLMAQCWLRDPTDRPAFSEIRDRLGVELHRCSPELHDRLQASLYDGLCTDGSYPNWPAEYSRLSQTSTPTPNMGQTASTPSSSTVTGAANNTYFYSLHDAKPAKLEDVELQPLTNEAENPYKATINNQYTCL